MREIVATGKTVELAIQQACTELGVSRDEVNVEVLEVEVKRLFRSVPAKVRVTVEEEEDMAAPAPVPAAPAPKAAPVPAPEKPAEPKAPAAHKPAEKKPAPEKKPRPEQPARQAEEKKPAEPEQPATGEKAEAAVKFVQDVVAAMQVEVDGVKAIKQGEATLIRVEGDKVGALIGRRGETMEALSYLTGLVANRTGGDYEKVSLDVAGYRSKREQDLAAMARRVGARVQKTGRSQALEPMSSYDRRIVHSVIGGMENLTSESTGEGAARRVVVRSTAPGATEGSDKPMRGGRGGNRGGRGGRNGGGSGNGGQGGRAPRKDADRGPRKQPTDRPERKLPTGEAPVAVPRSSSLDESFDLPLYGKIEF